MKTSQALLTIALTALIIPVAFAAMPSGSYLKYDMTRNMSKEDLISNETNVRDYFLVPYDTSSVAGRNVTYNPDTERLEFKGQISSWEVHGYEDLSLTGNISALCWVNVTGAGNEGSDSHTILAWKFSYGSDRGFVLNLDAAGTLNPRIINGQDFHTSSGQALSIGTEALVSMVYNGTHFVIRKNNNTGTSFANTYNGDASGAHIIFGKEPGSSGPVRALNGTLRYCSVYNRALNQTEIQQYYDHGTPAGQTLYTRINFSQSLGTINSKFFCVVDHSWPLETSSLLQTNGAPTCSGFSRASNETFHLNLMSQAVWSRRFDINIAAILTALDNQNVENWVYNGAGYNTQTNFTGSAFTANYPQNWDAESTGPIGSVGRSSTAHEYEYSVNITKTSGSGSVFTSQTLSATGFQQGTTYTVEGWALGTAGTTYTVHLQQTDGFTSVCSSGSKTGTGSWVFFNCSWTPGTLYGGYRLVLEVTGVGSVLFDDIEVYQNGSYWGFISDSVGREAINRTMIENGIGVNFIADYMDAGLANLTNQSGLCPSDTSRCPPLEPARYAYWTGESLEYYTFDNTLTNWEWECWNEPDLAGFWLPGISASAANVLLRAPLFANLCNALAVEMRNRWGKVGILGSFANVQYDPFSGQDEFAEYVINNTYTNYTENGKLKLGDHKYYSFQSPNIQGYEDIETEEDICSNVGLACNVYKTEFNRYPPSSKNDSNNQGDWVSNVYSELTLHLNNYPQGQACLYGWSEQYYYNCTSSYPEYPQHWKIIDELENRIWDPYWILTNYTDYFARGSTIVNVTFGNIPVSHAAAANNTTHYVFTVGNLANFSKPQSVYVGSADGTVWTANNGTNYTASGGLVNFTLAAYDYEFFSTSLSAALVDCGSTYAGTRVAVTSTQAYYVANSSCSFNGTRADPDWACAKVGGCVGD